MSKLLHPRNIPLEKKKISLTFIRQSSKFDFEQTAKNDLLSIDCGCSHELT